MSLKDAKKSAARVGPLATCPAARNREPRLPATFRAPRDAPWTRPAATLHGQRYRRVRMRRIAGLPRPRTTPRGCASASPPAAEVAARRDESPLAKSHPANGLPHQEPRLLGAAFKGCTGAGDLPARVMEAGSLPNARSPSPDTALAQEPRSPPSARYSGDMAGPFFDAVERAQLANLLAELGPDAPTLLPPWTTRDVAAHLVLRERDPLAGPGLSCPARGAAWPHGGKQRSRCGTSHGSSRRSGRDRRQASSVPDGCGGCRASTSSSSTTRTYAEPTA